MRETEWAGLADIKVMPMHGLLMKFAEACGAQIIVRGLRAVQDFEYEFQMTAMNEQLNPDIETVFLMADVRHQAVASRLVKEIASLGRRHHAVPHAGCEARPDGKVREVIPQTGSVLSQTVES
jgi:pantetheine-phosphate adenylyltransferase